MNKDDILKRIELLTSSIQQAVVNHNALMGRLEEAKHFLSLLENGVTEVEHVIDVASQVLPEAH
jgi:hypothetical protein